MIAGFLKVRDTFSFERGMSACVLVPKTFVTRNPMDSWEPVEAVVEAGEILSNGKDGFLNTKSMIGTYQVISARWKGKPQDSTSSYEVVAIQLTEGSQVVLGGMQVTFNQVGASRPILFAPVNEQLAITA
jgi:type 1 glutamine amidotransferase